MSALVTLKVKSFIAIYAEMSKLSLRTVNFAPTGVLGREGCLGNRRGSVRSGFL